MTSREWPVRPVTPDTGRWWAVVAARLLRSASVALTRWARPISGVAGRGSPATRTLEFYAEAGAPEGALYVDGQLVGHLPGVTRL